LHNKLVVCPLNSFLVPFALFCIGVLASYSLWNLHGFVCLLLPLWTFFFFSHFFKVVFITCIMFTTDSSQRPNPKQKTLL
jgi:hypothetical protein